MPSSVFCVDTYIVLVVICIIERMVSVRVAYGARRVCVLTPVCVILLASSSPICIVVRLLAIVIRVLQKLYVACRLVQQ